MLVQLLNFIEYVTCPDKMSVKLQISSSEILVLLERAETELSNGV